MLCASWACARTDATAETSPAKIVENSKSKEVNTLAQELSKNETMAKMVENFSMNLVLSFESEYLFRGKNWGKEAIIPKLEMDYDLGRGFSVYGMVGANVPLNGGENNEVDYYAGILYNIENFTFDLGYMAYTYMNNAFDAVNDHEIKFMVSYDTVDFFGEFNVSPYILYTYNFPCSGNFLETGLTYSAPLTKWLIGRDWGRVDMSAAYGIVGAKNSWGNYSYVELGASLVVAVNDYCSVSVGIRYAYNNDDGANAYGEVLAGHRVSFGTALSIGF